jgi:uncharacterized membrane protein
MVNKKSSVFNIDANLLLIGMNTITLILYLLPGARYFAWGIPMLVYLLENKNEFIRKQAVQSIMLFMIGSLFSIIIYLLRISVGFTGYFQYINGNLTGINSFLLGIVSILYLMGSVIIFTFAIIDMIRVYNYYDYSIPFLEKYTDKFRRMLNKIVGEFDGDSGFNNNEKPKKKVKDDDDKEIKKNRSKKNKKDNDIEKDGE